MDDLLRSIFGSFLSWWGAFLMGALDSSILFFLPFGIDAIVIYLAASNRDTFWVYPVLAATGSVAGAALTFWIGRKGGEAGLERLVPRRRLERLKARVRERGAVAMAAPALLPPPFPFTPFILTCGALDVDRWRFFGTLAGVRLLRFGAEALLAITYGEGVLRALESETFQFVVMGFIVVAIAGTAASGLFLWRSTRAASAG